MYSAVQREVWPIEDGTMLLGDRVIRGVTGEVDYERELNPGGRILSKDVHGSLTFETDPDVLWHDENRMPLEFSPVLADDEKVVRLYGFLVATGPEVTTDIDFVAMDATHFEVGP